jgi:hypothetical protein
MDYNKQVLPTQTNNGTDCIWAWPNTERDCEWSEEDMVEFTANGLWFAPDWKKCFRTNKYLNHGDKICGYTWRAHRLDKTGGYILFLLLFWHKGFYHDEFNNTFIQAQLFAAPSMGKDIGHLTHSFAGQDFINGNLNKSIIAELTHNVITRWDESYPLLEFPPCSEFQDKDVDPVKNRQIPQEKFYKVPLIRELVNQFQEIFCHLTITQVWLLWKSKSGDGFQGRHQDKLTGITNTIVVNLGGSDDDRNNEEEDMWKSNANNVPAQANNAMENSNNKQNVGRNIIGNKEGIVHREAMEKKNCKQEESAIKAMKICGQAALESGVGIGALVSLKVDYRSHWHAQGLLAIVYRFQENSGGILVCCEHGIITHDGTCNNYWVPYNKYRVIAWDDTRFPISDKLQAVCDKVLAGNFVDAKITPRISFSKYVDIDLGMTSPVKKAKGCSCKKGCNKRCG